MNPATDDAVIAEITRFNDELLRAIGSADLATLEALTYERYITLGPDRPALIGRDAAMAVYRRAKELLAVQERWTPIETLLDGDIAYQRGLYDIELTSRTTGKKAKTTGRYLNVYRRQPAGQWIMTMNSFVTEAGGEIWDELLQDTDPGGPISGGA